jgi:F0F1-type ATP synthase alpha subunit
MPEEVAGTLKVDQAQYRELKLSQIGSDLEALNPGNTQQGGENVEILSRAV